MQDGQIQDGLSPSIPGTRRLLLLTKALRFGSGRGDGEALLVSPAREVACVRACTEQAEQVLKVYADGR